jgi:Ankyrin repeats (3 copies)
MPDNNALHIAAKNGNLAEVQAQVKNFDINAKGKDGGTALYWAAREGKTEVVKFLLTFNPDVNLKDVSILKIRNVFMSCIYDMLQPNILGMCCYHAQQMYQLASLKIFNTPF